MTGPADVEIREADLVHEAVLPVLGVPVRLRSDSADVIRVFERAYAYWRVLAARPDLLSPGRIEGRIVVAPGDEGPAGRAPVRHRLVDRRRMLIATPCSV
jgi:hypothetical protein